MNWARLVGIALAVCLHGSAIYMILGRSEAGALAKGNGHENLTVVATVSLESGDLFTQSAQEASTETAASHAVPKTDTAPKPKIETPRQDTTQSPETADAAPEVEVIPPMKMNQQDEQEQKADQMASAASAAQDAQEASAAEAARRSREWSLYQTELYSALERHKVHIAKAGEVLLQVTIAPSGQVLNRIIAKSSGVPEIDNAAIAAIERASPFPPIPADIVSGPLTLAVPFRFRTH